MCSSEYAYWLTRLIPTDMNKVHALQDAIKVDSQAGPASSRYLNGTRRARKRYATR